MCGLFVDPRYRPGVLFACAVPYITSFFVLADPALTSVVGVLVTGILTVITFSVTAVVAVVSRWRPGKPRARLEVCGGRRLPSH